jgi:hypothetical protein
MTHHTPTKPYNFTDPNTVAFDRNHPIRREIYDMVSLGLMYIESGADNRPRHRLTPEGV